MRVTLYTREGCDHCERVRREITVCGDRVEEVNLTRHPEAIPELLKLTGGRRVVPVVVRGGRVEVAPGGGSEL